MSRTFETLFLAVVVGFLLATTPGSVRADDPPVKEPKELQGTWKLVSVEIDGKATDPIGGQPKWVIKGEKVFYGGTEIAGLKVDASTSPRVIDIKFSDPERVYEGIYAVEKGTLKICINRQTEGTKIGQESYPPRINRIGGCWCSSRRKMGRATQPMVSLATSD